MLVIVKAIVWGFGRHLLKYSPSGQIVAVAGLLRLDEIDAKSVEYGRPQMQRTEVGPPGSGRAPAVGSLQWPINLEVGAGDASATPSGLASIGVNYARVSLPLKCTW